MNDQCHCFGTANNARACCRLSVKAGGGEQLLEVRILTVHGSGAYNRACKWVTVHGVTPRDWSLLGTRRD